MDFEHSKKVRELQSRLTRFMEDHVYPAEPSFAAEVHANRQSGNAWIPTKVIASLQAKARAEGLWNLFLPESEYGIGLTNLRYAPLCEIMGRSWIGPEVFNCNTPDAGNMETLMRYGSAEQKKKWLVPLLAGEIRSAFAITEPDVASSDTTNIEASIQRDGDCYVINGRKWWTTGGPDPRCRIMIFMGKTDAGNPDRHKQQSMILIPMDTPGVSLVRVLPVFGYDDAPHGHGEFAFENVQVPVANVLSGEGQGFEIAQSRLGPGSLHRCMRLIGQAERSLEYMCRRAVGRVTFGRAIADQSVTQERIANARIALDQARLLVLHAAWTLDTAGSKAAKKEIAMIKVATPSVACQVIDWAIQVHGAAGVGDDFPLAFFYAQARTLRFADGPDEFHRNQIAKFELAPYRPPRQRPQKNSEP